MRLGITRATLCSVAAACAAALAPSAQAALVTLAGDRFDLVYDSDTLGAYGTPTLVGDVLFFTGSGVSTAATDGRSTSTGALLEGLVVRMHAGQALGGLQVSVFGDYRLQGAGSSVSVNGTLGLFDATGTPGAAASATLAVSSGTPLTLADGATHDWLATATLDATSAGAQALFGGGIDAFGISLSTLLAAGTDAAGSGLRVGFIEQKFTGLQLAFLPPVAVASPSSLVLALAALAAFGLAGRRHPSGPVRSGRTAGSGCRIAPLPFG